MPIWQAFILGLVQGLTEFLPISSSGHLVIVQQWFGIQHSVLAFDVFIHLATLIAIIIFFGKKLFKVTFKEWLIIGVGTIPAAAIGILFKDQIEEWFKSDMLVGIELIITGLINFYTDWKLKRAMKPAAEATVEASVNTVTWRQSLVMGIFQAVAIIPGISRSGSTVAAGIGQGLDRETAFRFSFLLAIPALAGAGVLQLKDVLTDPTVVVEPVPWLVGGAAALVAGLASLFVFQYVMTKARLEVFGWYCVIAGVLVTLSLTVL